ncbi:hypothetical protein WT11_23835 [Burkholderia stagnalis]|uniref:B12-binding domain-containing radical SAM protein n=1 Tax=Burkholderia stagnalis TaxID=1503054 RepID=UPI00075F5693|nr:radical SAM protein [Burkholderia stagnalis]KVN30150.1 hypothetical protein WT11_23835 [Burkholderia stagnalis]
MAKVLLINPNIKIVDREKDHYSIMEHLGLGLLSAALKKDGHVVRILDCYAHNLSNDAAVGAFLAFEPDFVGLTANYLNFDAAVEVAELARQVLDDVYVFVGGEHCTYAAEEILARHPAIQAVVRGEGEEAVVELVAKAPKLLGVAGVYFRDVRTNILFKNPDRPGIEDLDRLPLADRATLDYCRRRDLKTAIGVIAQRGCNFKCTFCNANKYLRLGGGAAIRRRTVKNVVDELEYLYEHYFLKGNVEKLYFYDANFIDGSNRSKAWARDLAHEIVRRGVAMPFEVYLRGDSLKGDDDEVVTDLKRAGLEAAFIGIESFDQQDLGFYGKDITTERLTEGLDLLRRHRVLGPTAGVIMFNPYSTVQGIRTTARLLARFGYASFWNLSQRLQLFPGVKLVDELRDKGLLDGYDKSNKVYSYRFQEPMMGRLSDHLLQLNDEVEIVRDNALPRHVSTELNRILNAVELHGLDEAKANRIAAPAMARLQSINGLNVEYFLQTIAHFEGGSDAGAIAGDRQSYLGELGASLDSLETEFSTALHGLHDWLISERFADDLAVASPAGQGR